MFVVRLLKPNHKKMKASILTILVIILLAFNTACKKDKDDLINIDFNGKLYVHPSDNSTGMQWGCFEHENTPGATSLTDGKANTMAIINFHNSLDNYAANPAQCHEDNDGSIAALICNSLDAFGYNDWYLPSKDELNALFENKDAIGGFTNDVYWSSTEATAYLDDFVWLQNFDSGQQYGISKTFSAKVRCVRRD